MKLWVTRTEPDAEATARRLRDLGHEPVVAPLLEVRPLAGVKADFRGVSALAFTSRNGVSAFAALSKRRNLPVYTVGEATAEAARHAGFGAVSSADGDINDLVALIAVHPPTGKLLCPGPVEPAGDLIGQLAGHGVACTLLPVYETVPTDQKVPDALDGVIIHSPKAGRVLAELLTPAMARELRLYAISAAAASPLSHLPFTSIEIAPEPDETALLGLTARPVGANQRTMTTTESASTGNASLNDAVTPPADPAVYRRGKGVSRPVLILACAASVVAGVAISGLVLGLPGSGRPDEPESAAPALPWFNPQPRVEEPAPLAPPPAALPMSGDVADLAARLDRVEAAQQRTVRAASAALAVSALSQAGLTSRPFTAELAAVETLLPQADVAALRRAAQTGIPTRRSLAEEFPIVASRASAAANAPGEDAGLIARTSYALSSIVTIRRVEGGTGKSADAIIARAEQMVQDGDLEGALVEMRRLPAAGRNAFVPWLAKAERRIEVDRRLAAVRASSMAQLRASLAEPRS